MGRIKLIIADSNDLGRIGLRSIFEGIDKIEITDEVSNFVHLKKSIENERPDIVIIDFTSKGFSVDNIATLKRKYRNLRWIAITVEQSPITLINAIRSGVSSYVKKDCSKQEIIDAAIETARGGKFFCGQIIDAIQRNSIDTELIRSGNLDCDPVVLSKREEEVLQLIAEGYTNSEIAGQLFLSNHTVNTHRRNIMNKLGVNNTAGIVMYAVREGLVSPNKFLFSRN